MIKQASLIDIYDASSEIRNAFMDLVELNGNPFYHRWHIDDVRDWEDSTTKEKRIQVDFWLKEQGLSKSNIVIITGGW